MADQFHCDLNEKRYNHNYNFLIELFHTVPSVANKINDDISVESGTPFCRQFKNTCDLVSIIKNWKHSLDFGYFFRIVSIDMKDWCIECFSNIRCVERRTGFLWVCGEPDLETEDSHVKFEACLCYLHLVVAHNMDCTSRVKSF